MATSRCRACGESNTQLIVSLGCLPLANSLLYGDKLDAPEPRFPLDLVLCPDCSLVQITETISPEELFRDYVYFSSVSDTMLRSVELLCNQVRSDRRLGPDSLVVEIGSNDGYLLQFYGRQGIPVLGIDPALNIARVARETHAIPTIDEFFNADVATNLVAQGKKADVIHAHNVLAHVAELNSVVDGISLLLADNGVAVVEVPYVRDLVERCEFDTIYHEHLCYFSVTSIRDLFERHRLQIERVERVPIHGGSLRLFVSKVVGSDPSVARLVDEERQLGMHTFEYYGQLAARMRVIKADLRTLLQHLHASGKRVAAYGAAAKGATLLGYCELGADLIEYVVDRSEHKQGRLLPGARLPIREPSALLETQPDYVVLLAWNIADEVLAQQREYRRRGGQFIIPVPEVRIMPAGDDL